MARERERETDRQREGEGEGELDRDSSAWGTVEPAGVYVRENVNPHNKSPLRDKRASRQCRVL